MKDIDFFVPHGADFEAISDFLLSTDSSWVERDLVDAYGDNFPASRIVDYRVGDLLVNVVAGATPGSPRYEIARFDFGLCQIWFDGENVVTTAPYEWDKAERTITLITASTIDAVGRSLERYKRLAEKYEWPLRLATVVPFSGVGACI